MGAMVREQMTDLDLLEGSRPGWFLEVCAEIRNGWTLDEAYGRVTQEAVVSWGAFRTWMKADDAREAAYQSALADRNELRRERVAANVYEIAKESHKELKPADTLRAAEMVLDSGVKDSAPISITIIHESA